MTDRIEAAAAELRPLLQEFILWVPDNAPGSDPELVGPAALWHRLAVRDEAGLWKRGDLRTVLLEHFPKAVEDPEAAIDALMPAMRSYLTFLSSTGRLSPSAASLDVLLSELDELEDDFVDAMEDVMDAGTWDDDEDDDEFEEVGESLGDFEPFAERIAALPTIRLRSDAELAEAARGVPLIAQARDLALWVGTGRKVGTETLLSDDEVSEAVQTLGLPDAQYLWNIWNLAIDLEFLTPDGGDTVSVDPDTSGWPFDDDDDVLDVWATGLHSIDYGDPELDDDDLTLALSGLTRALLIQLLLNQGSRTLADLREELAQAVSEYDDLGLDAWAAAGDPLASVVAWLSGYGMVAVDDGVISLTPLGTDGVVHLLDDEDVEVSARPAIDAMSALDLLSLSADMTEEEADAEFASWLALRTPAQAASELLAAAADDESDALVRVQAASLVGSLGEAAVPAWHEAAKEPSLRPYAATHLTQMGIEGAPEPTPADTDWLILDMWTISAGLGRAEFLSSLHEIGPAQTLVAILDGIWKIRHPHLEELLEAISDAHPDKQVSKAAKRALFKARSGN
ncbi:hypothetical protein ACQP1K_22425 [Sphaerimonospora sp. CA-214678]|uniref:hypothetical protein n=1 Tax=Sphaerimonospora sp. CA-214678 TaxID=3240029 RepID=UPI003D94B1F1